MFRFLSRKKSKKDNENVLIEFEGKLYQYISKQFSQIFPRCKIQIIQDPTKNYGYLLKIDRIYDPVEKEYAEKSNDSFITEFSFTISESSSYGLAYIIDFIKGIRFIGFVEGSRKIFAISVENEAEFLNFRRLICRCIESSIQEKRLEEIGDNCLQHCPETIDSTPNRQIISSLDKKFEELTVSKDLHVDNEPQTESFSSLYPTAYDIEESELKVIKKEDSSVVEEQESDAAQTTLSTEEVRKFTDDLLDWVMNDLPSNPSFSAEVNLYTMTPDNEKYLYSDRCTVVLPEIKLGKPFQLFVTEGTIVIFDIFIERKNEINFVQDGGVSWVQISLFSKEVEENYVRMNIEFKNKALFEEFAELYATSLCERKNDIGFVKASFLPKPENFDENFNCIAYEDEFKDSDCDEYMYEEELENKLPNKFTSDEEMTHIIKERLNQRLKVLDNVNRVGRNKTDYITLNTCMTDANTDKTFVFDDNKVSIFELSDNPSIINTSRMNKKPIDVLLSNQETKAIYLDSKKNLFSYDIEQEMTTGLARGKIAVDGIVHTAKYDQKYDVDEFYGFYQRGMLMFDKRVDSGVVDEQTYSSNAKIICMAVSKTGLIATGSSDGTLRLFSEFGKRAKSLYPGLGSPIIGLDISSDCRKIIATTPTYLLLFTPIFLNKGKITTGFECRMSDANKQPAIKLQLTSNDLTRLGDRCLFTPAKFNSGDGKETCIVTSTGTCVVSWNVRHIFSEERNRQVQNGERDYTISNTRYFVEDGQFVYNNAGRIVCLTNDKKETNIFIQKRVPPTE
eukprot:TRINITY_DN1279_c0_g1_i1.p1 TRINITY_DN1279_c0_g1~~TRINITY_DN1279_c0_g1_i1.p1  ORF type:complete len:791 (+),score=227.91 TRINITY_DN1279_c0_g1_i1:32-2404(+)